MKKRKQQMSGKDIKEALRLSKSGASLRQTAALLKVTHTTVNRWLARCEQLNLGYEAASALSDEELRERVVISKGPKRQDSAIEDIEHYYELLNNGYSALECYEQYQKEKSSSSTKVLSRATFYRRLNRYSEQFGAQAKRKMVSQWVAGEYMQIDYAGDVIHLKPEPDGKKYKVRVFVATLCFSRLTFWYATKGATTDDWIEAIVAAFEYFGGVPKYLVLDNDTALVDNAKKGAKKYNKKFADLCSFYGIEPSATRVARPRDKGMAESAVRICEQKFIRKIKPGVFKRLDEIRTLMQLDLEQYNNFIMPKYQISRRQWYEKSERRHMKGLPAGRFSCGCVVQNRKVTPEGYVHFETHQYMVPAKYSRKSVCLYVGKDNLVHITENEQRQEICSYPHYKRGVPDSVEGFIHSKPEFKLPGELSPAQRLEKASELIKGKTAWRSKFFEKFIKVNSHYEKGALADMLYGALRTIEKYSAETIEAACEHAMAIGATDTNNLFIYLSSVDALNAKDSKKKKPSTNSSACLRPADELCAPTTSTSH